MSAMNTLRDIAKRENVPLSHISETLGYRPNYVSVAINKGNTPSVELYARMLDVCGYGLYAIPKDKAPKDAVQITAECERSSRQESRKVNHG